MKTYIVVGTTLKFDGALYLDGEMVELPEAVAARCRVRPATAEEAAPAQVPIEKLTKAQLVEMGAGIGLELDEKAKKDDLLAKVNAELERLHAERGVEAELERDETAE